MRLIFIFFVVFFGIKSIAIELSEAQKEYILSKKTIKVNNEQIWAPFNYNENKKPKGLSIDTILLVAKKVGLEVEFVTGPTWNEFINMIKSGEIDVMLNIVPTDERKKFLAFTTPYQLAPHAVILNKNSTKKIKNIDDLVKLLLLWKRDLLAISF